MRWRGHPAAGIVPSGGFGATTAKGQWNNSHCPPCEAKRLADQPAKDRATFKLAYDLARRERQKARRAKAAKTATPQTGPIVVPKGQPYRP